MARLFPPYLTEGAGVTEADYIKVRWPEKDKPPLRMKRFGQNSRSSKWVEKILALIRSRQESRTVREQISS